jgi:two-component system sensor histidine kinase KdpD
MRAERGPITPMIPSARFARRAQKGLETPVFTMMTLRAVAISLGASVVATTMATTTSWLLLDHRLADIVVVYLLGVVLVALRFGHVASLLTALLGVAAFDFFFTLPYFSLADLDQRYLSTYALMLFVGSVISHQTARIRCEIALAKREQLRTS